eukprot:2130663-Rhodomonas_salina.1
MRREARRGGRWRGGKLVEDLHATAARTHKPTLMILAWPNKKEVFALAFWGARRASHACRSGAVAMAEHTCIRCWTPGTILRASSMFCLIFSAARLLNGVIW